MVLGGLHVEKSSAEVVVSWEGYADVPTVRSALKVR